MNTIPVKYKNYEIDGHPVTVEQYDEGKYSVTLGFEYWHSEHGVVTDGEGRTESDETTLDIINRAVGLYDTDRG
jgi:hypothetical protein